eukprot:scaffold18662_cov101-Skeletonema_dohrnii-CCMP3373.AAC.3
MTLLELALWKAKLDGNQEEKPRGRLPHETEVKESQDKIDTDSSRQELRVKCGAAIIINNVLPFLQLEE